mmetsp:Transcript_23489/g.69799  ORF Transcript_23489/g.69799 Transcript_23489/m.69799 type:complete len:246 (+) Transcript_23489:210-947(+)
MLARLVGLAPALNDLRGAVVHLLPRWQRLDVCHVAPQAGQLCWELVALGVGHDHDVVQARCKRSIDGVHCLAAKERSLAGSQRLVHRGKSCNHHIKSLLRRTADKRTERWENPTDVDGGSSLHGWLGVLVLHPHYNLVRVGHHDVLRRHLEDGDLAAEFLDVRRLVGKVDILHIKINALVGQRQQRTMAKRAVPECVGRRVALDNERHGRHRGCGQRPCTRRGLELCAEACGPGGGAAPCCILVV